jgi:hypothetical protein
MSDEDRGKKKVKVLTQYASHANTIADTFRAALAQTKIGEHTIDMTAPEESTHGGRLALQHVVFRAPSGMALVVGVVNAGAKRAELRTFGHVVKMYFERFKKTAPFTEADYDAFVERSTGILGAFGLEIERKDPDPSAGKDDEDAAQRASMASLPPAPARPSRALPIAAAVVVLALIVGGGVAFWFLRLR